MTLKYRHSILLLDDEKPITSALGRLFHREKYNILTSSSGEEALGIIRNSEKPISLVISDQRMPGMNGSSFLAHAKEISPHTIRFLLTGYTDVDALADAVNKGEIHRYITKPWNDSDLLLLVRQSLEQYELTLENRRLLALLKKQNGKLKELNSGLEQKVEERSREILLKNKELSRLNNELESGLYNTVRAFASLAEMHAPMLAGHGTRVGLLSRQIALAMGLPENEITNIEVAGLLHDLGKLGFPMRLLENNEEGLTPEEKRLFRKHPEEGQSIVRFINRLDHVGLLIRSHHERVDGQGYPDQLAEDVIPLGSKIISVADAYDKISNMKNGSRWMSEFVNEQEIIRDHSTGDEKVQQAALYHLRRYAFTSYDPDVVKVFLGMLDSKGIRYQKEKALSILELREGMTLTRSIYTSKGRFLLPHKTVLSTDLIQKLRSIDEGDAIKDKIWVADV